MPPSSEPSKPSIPLHGPTSQLLPPEYEASMARDNALELCPLPSPSWEMAVLHAFPDCALLLPIAASLALGEGGLDGHSYPFRGARQFRPHSPGPIGLPLSAPREHLGAAADGSAFSTGQFPEAPGML